MIKAHALALTLTAAGAAILVAPPSASAEDATAIVAQGEFEGRSDHATTGGLSILKTASGHVALLEADFSLDGAPSPTLGFGKAGAFDKDTEFTKLERKSGLQAYAIPAGVDPADYDEFYVWCARFSIPLGVAKLTD